MRPRLPNDLTWAHFRMWQSLGTAVFGGMLGVAGFGLLFTPGVL